MQLEKLPAQVRHVEEQVPHTPLISVRPVLQLAQVVKLDKQVAQREEQSPHVLLSSISGEVHAVQRVLAPSHCAQLLLQGTQVKEFPTYSPLGQLVQVVGVPEHVAQFELH